MPVYAWNVYQQCNDGTRHYMNTVFYTDNFDAEEIKNDLIESADYPSDIVVELECNVEES